MKEGRTWIAIYALFVMVSVLKLLLLAPGLYHSTDFEVHRNWLAVTHSRPLREWYWEDTSEWTLDYPPIFGYFQWSLSQAAAIVEPDLVTITTRYEPSRAAEWFQRVSVVLVDVTLVLGVIAWCGGRTRDNGQEKSAKGMAANEGNTRVALGALVLLNPGLIMVDHVHFQYNGFLLGVLLLSMGWIRQGKVPLGGAAFACLLMLKHLFLAAAPLYFVYLLRSYCCCCCYDGDLRVRREGTSSGHGSSGSAVVDISHQASPTRRKPKKRSQTGLPSQAHDRKDKPVLQDGSTTTRDTACSPSQREEALTGAGLGARSAGLFLKRLTALGSVVLCVFGAALGPLCASGGLSTEACLAQLRQLGIRLFPFGRGLVHAYWAPNAWAGYLFLDRALLAMLKMTGLAGKLDGVGSTTGGLVQAEVMAVLPSVSAGVCLLLSLIACGPALYVAWKKPSSDVFTRGVVHCSLSTFMVGYHVHEKALLVPAVISALLAFRSIEGARMHLRLSFLAAFAAFPLLPGADLRVFKVLLVGAHLAMASSLLGHRFPPGSEALSSPGEQTSVGSRARLRSLDTAIRNKIDGSTPLWTLWDKIYVVGAGGVFVFAEIVHPITFEQRGALLFLPLMSMSVYGAVGVTFCWGLSFLNVLSA